MDVFNEFATWINFPREGAFSLLLSFFVIMLCVIIIMIHHWERMKPRPSKEERSAQTESLWPQTNSSELENLKEKKVQFLRKIKERYRELHNEVLPGTRSKDGCTSETVFVNGGIEILNAKGEDLQGVRKKIESYKEIFSDTRTKSKRYIVESAPGFGKTAVSLQIAYDWCNSNSHSYLGHIDILLYLPLRNLGGVPSIYSAIKKSTLPKGFAFSEKDVATLIQGSESVLIILDGFDEYPEKDNPSSDVNLIIARRMFQDVEAITTTRSSILPKIYPPLTTRVKLTGFDEKARINFIRKVMPFVDDKDVQLANFLYRENLTLNDDLCQVPLLFTKFSLIPYGRKELPLNNPTSLLRFIINCFYGHLSTKMDQKEVSDIKFVNENSDLDKLAFESFNGDKTNTIWRKNKLCQRLGFECYDQYLRTGILVEDQYIDITDEPGTCVAEHVKHITSVRFSHKLFSEWFAACYANKYIEQNSNVMLKQFLKYFDPHKKPHFFRFICGLSRVSAEKVVDYLKNINGCKKFAIICSFERIENADAKREILRAIRQYDFFISGYDGILEQRTYMQLLHMAAELHVILPMVSLFDCITSVKLSPLEIHTTTGLALPPNLLIYWLEVCNYNRDLTEKEVYAVLEYSSNSRVIKFVNFRGRGPPSGLKVGTLLSNLHERKVSVTYIGISKFRLNLKAGKWEWEKNNSQISEDEMAKKNAECVAKIRSERTVRQMAMQRRSFARTMNLKLKKKMDELDVAEHLEKGKDK